MRDGKSCTALTSHPLVKFVMAIIQVHIGISGSATYPPATVSMIGCSACQAMFCALYFIRNGRGFIFIAKNALISTTLFSIWQLGMWKSFVLRRHAHSPTVVTTSYTTSQWGSGPYCGPTSAIRADCVSCLKVGYLRVAG